MCYGLPEPVPTSSRSCQTWRRARSVVESAATATGAATRQKVEWVLDAARGRDLVLHTNVTQVIVTDDRAAAAAKVARGYGVDEASAFDIPHSVFGTIEQIAEQLVTRRAQLGISYYSIFEPAMDAFAPVIELLRGH